MSHWTMLKAITIKGMRSRLTPATAIITVKKSVDKPMIRATVPIIENRSFHKLTKLSPKPTQDSHLYNLYYFRFC